MRSAPFGHPSQILLGLDDAVAAAQATQRDRISGQTSLFDLGADDPAAFERPLPTATEVPVRERLRWEKELLGLYLSEHPMGEVAERVGRFVTAYSSDLRDESLDGQRVVVGGIVTGVRTVITKAKATMAIVTLEDLQGTIEVVVFPRLYEQTMGTWRDGEILLVAGRVDHKSEDVSLLADLAVDWDEAAAAGEEAFARQVAAGRARRRAARLRRLRQHERQRQRERHRVGRSRAADGGGRSRPHTGSGHGRRGPWRRAVHPVRLARGAAAPSRPSARPRPCRRSPRPSRSRPTPRPRRRHRARGRRRTLGPGRGAVPHRRRRHQRRPDRRRSGDDPPRPVRGQRSDDRVVGAMEAFKSVMRERPGATRVVIHVPGPGGGEMELRRGVAYDAEMLAEVRRRLGDGLVDLRLA